MYSGQDANSGLQPVMSSQPIVSSGDAVVLSPEVKKPKRWPIVVVVVLILVAIGTGVAALLLTRTEPVAGDVVNAYIEYFAYGTEGENQVNASTFEMASSDYAIVEKMSSVSAEESTEYYNKLSSKFAMVESIGRKEINADLLKNNGIYLGYYKAIMQSMYSGLLMDTFNNGEDFMGLYKDLTVGDNEFLETVYNTLNNYAKARYDFYTQVKGWGCLSNGIVDYNCIWGIGKENDISNNNDLVVGRDLNQYNNVIYSALVGSLNQFYKQGGKNE